MDFSKTLQWNSMSLKIALKIEKFVALCKRG